MKLSKILCKDCYGLVFGLLGELRVEAKKSKRGTLILDAIDDLEVSLIEGNISKIVARDKAYQSGRRIGRRISRG